MVPNTLHKHTTTGLFSMPTTNEISFLVFSEWFHPVFPKYLIVSTYDIDNLAR